MFCGKKTTPEGKIFENLLQNKKKIRGGLLERKTKIRYITY